MKLEKFKERDNKKIGVIVFTLVCVFLIAGAILYRTFAIFEVRINQNVINGKVQTGDILFTFYYEDEGGNYVITDQIPEGDYELSSSQSYCGFAGQHDENIKVSMNSDKTLEIEGLSRSSTKCKLYFEKRKIYNPFINTPIVTTGNGLYIVEHPEEETQGMDPGWQQTELRYAGPNPDNYVWFNCGPDANSGETCEKWRIIGLVNVQTSTGIEQRLKIIKDEMLLGYAWNSSGSNDWTKSSLMKLLNDSYYQNTTTFLTVNDYVKGLEESARDMIDKNIIWNLGGWKDSLVLTSAMYGYERGENVYKGRPTTWPNGKVGLMYPSDYGYAVGGTEEDRNTCLTTKKLWEYDSTGCYDNDWLYQEQSDNEEWMLSPDSSNPDRVFLFGRYINYDENDDYRFCVVDNVEYWARPVVYLSDKVNIAGNQGTVDDPFILSVQP